METTLLYVLHFSIFVASLIKVNSWFMLDMDVPIEWCITISVHVALEIGQRIIFLIDNTTALIHLHHD